MLPSLSHTLAHVHKTLLNIILQAHDKMEGNEYMTGCVCVCVDVCISVELKLRKQPQEW